MKQGIHERLKRNIINLSKVSGKRGKLKFRSQINCIPLKQFNYTHKILNQNYIKIQSIKQQIKVKGLKQIPKEAEYANANLIRKPDGYYLKLTCFLSKIIKDIPKEKYGIKTLIKQIPNKRIKSLQRKLSRQIKGSKNYNKTKNQLARLYQKQNNQKKDICNKIISYLTNNFQIIIQDENIKSWHSGWFGKEIQQSSIGGIIAGLKHNPHTLVVDKYFPSTKQCYGCQLLNDIKLSERLYICLNCGTIEDRDIHSAKNILFAEHKFKPMEKQIVENMLEYFKTVPGIFSSCFNEVESRLF